MSWLVDTTAICVSFRCGSACEGGELPDEQKPGESAVSKILIALVIALLAGSSSPWWWNEIKSLRKSAAASTGEFDKTPAKATPSAAHSGGLFGGPDSSLLRLQRFGYHPSGTWDMGDPDNHSTDCSNLKLNLVTGQLNQITPTVSKEEVQRDFSCYTGESAEGDHESNYGGGVFFVDHGFFVYTHRNFIEVRKGFVGEVHPDLVLGGVTTEVIAALGRPAIGPVRVAPSLDRYFFESAYGCLQLMSEAGSVVAVSIHHVPCQAAARDLEVMIEVKI
jgi:hypothetical protein